MPIFTVNTNLSDVPVNFKSKAAALIAKSLNKPVSHIAIQVNSGQNISFGGTDEAAALCNLASVGSLSPDLNKQHSSVITGLIEETLHVSRNRTFICFTDVDKTNMGFSGTTIAGLMQG